METNRTEENPMVTVLLTVYNRPSVVKTIYSILSQTFGDFEFLIVDNASTDNTCNIIRDCNDERIRLIVNEKNMGQTYSLNRGLELAKGKYIARIDADDIALPERLQKQVDFMETHDDYVLCGCWVRYINDDDKLTITMQMPTSDQGLRTMQLVTCGMYHPAAMMRKDILEKYDITYDPDIHMAEDYEMWRKLLQHGKGLNLSEVLVHYRRGSNNDSTTHQVTMGKECFIVRKRMCEEWDNESEAQSMKKVIGREEKQKKTIAEVIGIYRFYKNYLVRNIDKSSQDYKILKKYFTLKVYSASIHGNQAMWASAIKSIYEFLLKIRYQMGRRSVSK
jgi:glycosyltransferase involved in cell wall biosynthesis